MRGCLTTLAMGVAVIAAIVATIFAGIVDVILAFFVGAISIYLCICLNKAAFMFKRIDMTNWLNTVTQSQFKHAWDGTGIAVDPDHDEIHLATIFDGRMITKSYPLSSVKEWQWEIPGYATYSPGRTVGGGLHGAATDIGASVGAVIGTSIEKSKARESTGMTIRVADIDHPKWFVKFGMWKKKPKQLEYEMSRWMEILDQNVNGE